MKNKRTKKIIAIILAVVLTAGAGFGGWRLWGNRSSEPVYVYDFSMIGMTEYWGDTKESYGPITTDRVQTVYLSSTQTVTEVFVQPGDEVQKGDVLMTFDTTLSDLSLERKRLDVEKLKLQLEDAQEQLWQINSMEPMVIPPQSDEPEDVNLGTALVGDYAVNGPVTNDGSTAETPMICWLRDGKSIDDALFEWLRQKAVELQTRNQPAKPPAAGEFGGSSEGNTPTTLPSETTTPTTQPVETTAATTETTAATTQPTSSTTETTEQTDPSKPVEVGSFYVVFKVTEGNMSLGYVKTWQGVHVTQLADGSFSFSFYDASMIPDTSVADLDAKEEEDFYIGSGFTATQIAEMRADQEKAIRELEFSIKMAEAEYLIMQTEVSDGNIYAQFDGKVLSVLDEEEAKLNAQPFIKVSGGGGFYVEGSVSELDRESLFIGQEVTVNDWNTGNVYTGTIQRIGDYPSDEDNWYGDGNPNVSYYPFTVFVDGEADFMQYSYVSIMYSAGDQMEHGIYLENPFLRTENGTTYVYVLGEDGLLEKRPVTVGKSLWGSYTEILSGLAETDMIAFPYGKNVVPGAPAVEGDLSDLYGY